MICKDKKTTLLLFYVIYGAASLTAIDEAFVGQRTQSHTPVDRQLGPVYDVNVASGGQRIIVDRIVGIWEKILRQEDSSSFLYEPLQTYLEPRIDSLLSDNKLFEMRFAFPYIDGGNGQVEVKLVYNDLSYRLVMFYLTLDSDIWVIEEMDGDMSPLLKTQTNYEPGSGL